MARERETRGIHRGERSVKSAHPDNSQKRRKSIIDTPLFSLSSHARLTKVGKVLFPPIRDMQNEKLERRDRNNDGLTFCDKEDTRLRLA